MLKMPDDSSIPAILNRPISERLREHKWTGLMQALLAGWCLYLAALPMLSESLMLLAMGKMKVELMVALAAMILCVIGVVGWIFTLRGHSPLLPSAFALVVVILIAWSGGQWLRLARRAM